MSLHHAFRVVIVLVLLGRSWTAPLLAATEIGTATYRVTIVLYPGDDAAAVAKRLAAMYRGTLETPVDASGSFSISLSEAGAGLMRRDPVVAEMDTPSLVSSATPVSATAALPSSQRPVETHATTSWTVGPYEYDGSGNIRRVGSDFYVYDKLGRIVVSADAQTSVVHKQSYTYDLYGNLRSINSAGRPAATLEMAGASNRLASVSNGSTSAPVGYDGAGNFTSYLGATYEYDALNVMRKSVTGGVTRSYVYTANDERIGTIEQTGSALRSDWTIRDSAGQVLRRYSKESNGEWKWQEDYIYRGTQMLAAEIPDSPKTRHFHLDHLGTPRLITGDGGAEISRHTYHPFGEEIAPSPTAREKKQFTGHERDSESLDYMHARFYAPFMGRFLSVDPDRWYTMQNGTDEEKREFQMNLRRPPGWNRYSYAYNNPIRYTDPDGKLVLVDDAVIGLFILGSVAVVATEVYLQSPNTNDPRHTNAQVMGMQITSAVTGVIGTLTSLAQNNRHNQEIATSQLAAAAKELGKVSSAGGPEQDPDFNHHKSEIKAMLDRALRVAKRLPKKAYEEVLRQVREIGGQVGLRY